VNEKTINKINFLTKLDVKANVVAKLIPILVEEDLMSDFRAKQILALNKPQQINDLITEMDALPQRKIMIDWSWQILPDERLTLTIVGSKSVHVIEWGGV